uniref:Putative serine/threonine protein kinase n=1 Tax=Marseillevirus LCMAC201 TaxID=2506605 RepID=A0A481YVX3_9VIRU|nr:MAG: putative serine/threonine protein kinase [Marseillevirus LCMAC201]
MKILKAIQFSHDDLQQYSDDDIQMMAEKYLDIELNNLDRNDIVWLLAITLIPKKYQLGHMDVDMPTQGIVNVTKACLKGYQLKELLGKGGHGVVYRTCIKDDCNYAVKIIDLESDSIEDFKKESTTSDILSRKGVGPKYVGHWVCDDPNVGLIVTDKWDGSLYEIQKEQGHCLKLSKHLLDKLENEIKKIHDLGYVHLDIFAKNILYKKDRKGNVIDVTLTDFGLIEKIAEFKEMTGWFGSIYDYHQNMMDKLNYDKYYKEFIPQLARVCPKLLDYDYLSYLKECNNLPRPEFSSTFLKKFREESFDC